MRRVYPIDVPKGARLPEHGNLLVERIAVRDGAVIISGTGGDAVALVPGERVTVDENTPERRARLELASRELAEIEGAA